MDFRRLDALARLLVHPRTRRTVLQRLGGGLLVASAAAPLLEAEAGKGKGGKGNKKRCEGGKTRCDNQCVDLETDVERCGECDNACDPGQQCLFGECLDTCAPVCTAPEVCCLDECIDLTSEAEHCGQCFRACAENEVCRFANCGCLGPRCPAGGDATRCCPDANGTCCDGGGCCANNGVCTTSGLCCDAGYYQCPGTDVCCPDGLICDGFDCLVPERTGGERAARSAPAVKATPAR